MNTSFYAKLAKTNILKNAKHYVPFILTCIFTVTMFYLLCFAANNKGVATTGGETGSAQLKFVLNLGIIVIAIFAVLFLLYTNGFLVKQRKKEFALYHVLGMEKKHISIVIAIETAFVYGISLLIGLLLGFVFSKLMVLFICRLLRYEIRYGFEISIWSILLTFFVFTAIFLIMFFNNIKHVFFTNTIELLKGSNLGEKEPKVKWLFALIGFSCLASGYYLAITTTSPLEMIGIFLLAVILVIIGTYLLFITGSIAILKILRKNKKFYYQTKHFISVSGMIYRMKQNAAGLSNICILSTMVLVMVSTTTSLYTGMEDTLRQMHPKDYSIELYMQLSEQINQQPEKILSSVIPSIEENQIDIDEESIVQYAHMMLGIEKTGGNHFQYLDQAYYTKTGFVPVRLIALSDYNRITGKNIICGENEILLYADGTEFYFDTLVINQKEWIIKEHLYDFDITEFSELLELTKTDGSAFYIIMEDFSTLKEITEEDLAMRYYLGFNAAGIENRRTMNGNLMGDIIKEILDPDGLDSIAYGFSTIDASRMDFLSIYGGLFFLGIFLGVLFIMAAVLIMYYKQISEGYEDKKRFEIMQKVGMDQHEIKKAIRSQVLMVFFLPLLLACCHVAGAFKLITRMLALLNMTNEMLFFFCTAVSVAVFAIFYVVVYALTARTYYRIVK